MRYAFLMDESTSPSVVTIRAAVPADADGIARVFFDSAEHHAGIDPERYSVPAIGAIVERYREGRQHPAPTAGAAVTLVAECAGEIVGFLDARLEKSPDPMHKDMTYCHIVEIAVSRAHRNQGIGGKLLRAAEGWGRGRGAELASLEYNAANIRAGAFYERMGYRVASITAIRRL
jgi:ribosomal protein S18 acetylase RimI-like enzyme